MLTLVLVAFLVLLFLGVPVAFAIAAAAVVILLAWDLPLVLVPHRMFVQLDSFTLLALPLFILAGNLMEVGGISQRLFAFANSLTRHFRGGLAQATMIASIVMSGLSGSGVADISAIGSVAAPSMRRKGYHPAFIGAVLSAGGSLGPIIPPSILMIVYGSITAVSIGALFVAGIVAGLIMGGGFMLLIWWRARILNYESEPRASLGEIWSSFVAASWSLIAPLIIIGGILSGIFTATEAGAVAALYAFLIGTFVYRELHPRDYIDLLSRSATTTAVVLFIIATSGLFGWVLERMDFSRLAASAVAGVTDSPGLFLFILIMFLLALGTIVEILAAAIILIPVLDPLAAHFGLNPLHFAFVIVLALNIGSVTPPVGVYLYLANRIAGAKLNDTIMELWPFIVVMIAVVFLVAYVPEVALFLPRIFFPAAVGG